MVIPNFLSSEFEINKVNHKRKKIIVWSVQRHKGLDETLEMWIKSIYPNNKDTKFYIFGINILKFKRLKNFYNKYNIFFFGKIPKIKLRNIYSNSFAMICLGYDETFCLNALEANACGLPIITFGHTALKDFTVNNKNGYLVNNYDQLANKINDLCNSKMNKDIINYCYNYSKKFYLDKIINKWINLLNN